MALSESGTPSRSGIRPDPRTRRQSHSAGRRDSERITARVATRARRARTRRCPRIVLMTSALTFASLAALLIPARSSTAASRARRDPITIASAYGSVLTNRGRYCHGRYCHERMYCPLQLPPDHPSPRLRVAFHGRLRIALAFPARRVEVGFCRPEHAFHTLTCPHGRFADPLGRHGRLWATNVFDHAHFGAAIVQVLYRHGSAGYLAGLSMKPVKPT
jgi:hypothetical protein